jgi:hypothetical protein
MRKGLIAACLLVIMTGSAAEAQTGTKFGAGAFFGLSWPVVQEDQSRGTEYGFKVRYGVANMIVLEPFASFVKWGDPGEVDLLIGGTLDFGRLEGSKVTAFGLEATLGNLPGQMGVMPYFFAGIGSYKVENETTQYTCSKLGYSAGLGLGIGFSQQFSLDVRARAMIAPQDQGSKKAVGVVAGINFNFGGK